ncbi:flavodoxin family protein [Chloroflexota bacterium]
MQILMISGSRNREGRTAQAIEAISKGITKAGGNSESIFLTELNIERCRQCESDGWGVCGREHRCIIEDDFDSVAAKLKAVDAVVFANPVYFGDLSETTRTFLDRLRRISIIRPGTPPVTGPGCTPTIGICMAGGRGRNAPNCCSILERILQTCGFDVVDMIPISRQNLEFKLPILELTGEWLVTKPSSE